MKNQNLKITILLILVCFSNRIVNAQNFFVFRYRGFLIEGADHIRQCQYQLPTLKQRLEIADVEVTNLACVHKSENTSFMVAEGTSKGQISAELLNFSESISSKSCQEAQDVLQEQLSLAGHTFLDSRCSISYGRVAVEVQAILQTQYVVTNFSDLEGELDVETCNEKLRHWEDVFRTHKKQFFLFATCLKYLEDLKTPPLYKPLFWLSHNTYNYVHTFMDSQYSTKEECEDFPNLFPLFDISLAGFPIFGFHCRKNTSGYILKIVYGDSQKTRLLRFQSESNYSSMEECEAALKQELPEFSTIHKLVTSFCTSQEFDSKFKYVIAYTEPSST